jgi:hypothetical protein
MRPHLRVALRPLLARGLFLQSSGADNAARTQTYANSNRPNDGYFLTTPHHSGAAPTDGPLKGVPGGGRCRKVIVA